MPTALVAAAGLLCSLAVAPTHAAEPTTTRVPLAATVNVGDESLETDSAARVPDYLRALAATQPQAAQPFAKLLRVTLTRGSIAPNVKVAMGMKTAQLLQNEYAVAHLGRLLKTAKPASDALALEFAERLTKDINLMDDAFFARVRARYNDAQIVELTQTVATMNYFVRLCAALGLSPEPWLATTTPKPLSDRPAVEFGYARVTLATNAEMETGARVVNPPAPIPEQSARAPAGGGGGNNGNRGGGLGIAIPNSRRAMLRSPEIANAWTDYWASVRQNAKVPRPMQLQVSYAVSTANGCRYCTVHQVVGLRRSGVDIGKLIAMQKSDDALTIEEKAAVMFARKLTKSPASVTGADYKALETAFPNGTALEIVLQTCAFAYMNRFTDTLRLPSEDEAVEMYRETYQSAKAPLPIPGEKATTDP